MEKTEAGPLRGRIYFLMLIFAAIPFLCFPADSGAEIWEPFEDGRLFSAGGAPLSAGDFARQAAAADYVLIGETHDSPHHHLMQAALLEALARSGSKPAVGFEMLYSRDQDLLAGFNRREIKVEQLEKACGWSRSWSYPFKIYAPIFQVAERFDLPVYGLNISKATLDLVKAEGFDQLRASRPQKEIPDLPAQVIWPRPEQVESLKKVREGLAKWRPGGAPNDAGQSQAPEKSSATDPEPVKDNLPDGPRGPGDQRRFLLVQSLWDTSMAEAAVRARRATGRPVLIIAGSGHVESGYGIAHRLNILDPGRKILLVLPLAHPLGAAEAQSQASAEVFFASRPSILSLGLVFRAAPDRIIVDEIEDGSRAAAAGMKTGDQVICFEGQAMESPDDFHSAAAIADLRAKRGGSVEKREESIVVERAGKRLKLVLR
ncbi:MAG: ChaN family lipoprotein [Candidatus Adiutrix sp.]|jgi:uncharacterized iron-regulated protein|nr:ChaN family lipoprotein [Candidatus Adiutrix sp.]